MPRSRTILRPRRPRPFVPCRRSFLRSTLSKRRGPRLAAFVHVWRWRPARSSVPFLGALSFAGVRDVNVAPGLCRVLLFHDAHIFAGLVVVAWVVSGGVGVVGVDVHCCFACLFV